MDIFVQLTVAGLSNGAILALAALGFVLVYKASGVINFAQGQFLLVGAYVLWAAIVSIDMDTVGTWAERKRLNYTTYTDLAQKPEV